MAVVNTKETIEYGFQLMGIVGLLYIIGGVGSVVGLLLVFSSTGGPMEDPNLTMIILGAFTAVFSIAILFAGMLGLLYKVIADGVGKAAGK